MTVYLTSPDGKLWHIDGIFGAFQADAPSESQLWEVVLRYIKKWPEAQDRYLLKAEYFEQFTKVP